MVVIAAENIDLKNKINPLLKRWPEKTFGSPKFFQKFLTFKTGKLDKKLGQCILMQIFKFFVKFFF